MSSLSKTVKKLASLFKPITIPSGEQFMVAQGHAEGTSYHIVYLDLYNRDFHVEIEELLSNFEKSLSVYDPQSIISKVNRNEEVTVDNYFKHVFKKAKQISKKTKGTFDISAEPFFRAWGFSSEKGKTPDKIALNSLKEYIGMDKVSLKKNRVIKNDPRLTLNMNAIAKGYSADIIADFLEDKNIQNYLIEIGGEIRIKGLNPEAQLWNIGIDRPIDGNIKPGEDIQVILQITDRAIATSGNYRQFYINEKGEKISHTIDPRNGSPVTHNLLSTTVIAEDAMTADAFATAFMVVGVQKSMEWIKKFPTLDALFIYNEDGEYKVSFSHGMQKYILQVED